MLFSFNLGYRLHSLLWKRQLTNQSCLKVTVVVLRLLLILLHDLHPQMPSCHGNVDVEIEGPLFHVGFKAEISKNSHSFSRMTRLITLQLYTAA